MSADEPIMRVVSFRCGNRHVYTLKDGEVWAIAPDGRLVIAHPERPPKTVSRDGTEEEITWPPQKQKMIREPKE